ncbi:hypothetical protein BDP81DRAFT_5248 [Colletotrichum phormii]|uniref:Uncharacterized protein n=1 Tax=Colletotrichum phormii TaxID=359342 RepID=A0AAJ0A310_9PEZI|nr:uncharacterized protein BDP81DRAFT_5248 [Colletotrichum phormii]KAK1655506.1 hypothetical protein BDP81DRAFT_5248 [Colletotrichum phormii]
MSVPTSEKLVIRSGLGLGRKGTSDPSLSSTVILRLVSAANPLLTTTLPFSLPETIPDTGQHVGHPITQRMVQAGGGDRPSTTVLGPVHGSREPTPAASLTQFRLAYCPGHLSLSRCWLLAADLAALPCCGTVPGASIPDGMDRDAFCNLLGVTNPSVGFKP